MWASLSQMHWDFCLLSLQALSSNSNLAGLSPYFPSANQLTETLIFYKCHTVIKLPCVSFSPGTNFCSAGRSTKVQFFGAEHDLLQEDNNRMLLNRWGMIYFLWTCFLSSQTVREKYDCLTVKVFFPPTLMRSHHQVWEAHPCHGSSWASLKG